jgi:hypothetical protein
MKRVNVDRHAVPARRSMRELTCALETLFAIKFYEIA